MAGDLSGLGNVRGDFITIYDPATAGPGQPRTAFPGNVIPSSRIDPAAAKIVSFLPTARRSAGDPFTHLGNNTYLIPRPTNLNQYDLKFDHRFNDSNGVFFRYSWYHNDTTNQPTLPGSTYGAPNPADFGVMTQPVHSYQAVLGHTWTINPTTIFDWRGGHPPHYLPPDSPPPRLPAAHPHTPSPHHPPLPTPNQTHP